MNKARRHQLKMLKFKKRLKQLNLKVTEDCKYYQYRNSGTPCSCFLCRGVKYRDERNKKKK